MKYFPLPHRASQALGLADRRVVSCCVALFWGTCGYRPHDKFLKPQLPTRGVSNVGDATTSGQQNPHGGGTNGG